MNKDDTIYLQHLLDAILQIQKYVTKLEYIDFEKNQLVQDGVIRQIMVIGEQLRIYQKIFATNILIFPGKILQV